MRRRGRGGFTLVEILLALTIFSAVLLAIYSSWSSILKGSKVGLEAAAAAQRNRVAMDALEQSLLSARMFAENIRYYAFVADTSDEKFAYLSFVSALSPQFPGDGSARAQYGDQPVRRVTFQVEEAGNSTRNLILTQAPLLLATNAEYQPYRIVLARDVSLFSVEFWDDQRQEWGAELANTNALPRMVRVAVGVGREGQHSSRPVQVMTRIVAPVSAVVLREMQIPAPVNAGAPGRRPGPGQGVPGRPPGAPGTGRPLESGQPPKSGRPLEEPTGTRIGGFPREGERPPRR